MVIFFFLFFYPRFVRVALRTLVEGEGAEGGARGGGGGRATIFAVRVPGLSQRARIARCGVSGARMILAIVKIARSTIGLMIFFPGQSGF